VTEKFNYQKEAARTLIFEPDREIPNEELYCVKYAVSVFIMIGAITEYLKKAIFHQKGLKLVDLFGLYEELTDNIRIAEPHYRRNKQVPISLSGKQIMVLWVLTGLIGEVGEVSQLIFKWLFLGDELDKENLKDEIFDTCWYMVSLCTLFDIDWIEGQKHNAAKLRKRYPNGYNAEDSKLRRDVNQ